MDNSLRFPGEELISDLSSPKENIEDGTPMTEALFKELRGVACTMKFVKTKVEQSKIATGETLKIFLEDGEPIDKETRSVLGEGHKILKQEETEGYWTVIIEKT